MQGVPSLLCYAAHKMRHPGFIRSIQHPRASQATTFPQQRLSSLSQTTPLSQTTNRNENMPSYIVTCKQGATDEQVNSAKEHAKSQGGTITHEYNLIKGFAVKFDDDAIIALEAHEHVESVEADGEMRIQ